MTERTRRVDALLQEEISELLRREVGDPRIGFATVTDVETTPDLGHARVWISVLGRDEQRREALTALEHAMPFIRRRLGERLRLKRIPELQVREDTTGERGTRVMHILEELERGRIPEPLPAELPTPAGLPLPERRPARGQARARAGRRGRRG